MPAVAKSAFDNRRAAKIIDSEGGATVFSRTLDYDEESGRQRVQNWKRIGIPRNEWEHIIDKTKRRVTYDMLKAQAE